MISCYTTRELKYLGEVELFLEGEHIPSEPTITHPIDMAQEGTNSSIDGLKVTLMIHPVESDITGRLSWVEIDELTDELLGSFEQ